MNKLWAKVWVLFFLIPLVTAEERKAVRLNVLLISVDDLKPLTRAYGDPHAVTPNLDRLARRGRLFQNAQCQQAICTASRASLLTGLYPDVTGVVDLHTNIRDVNPDVVTLPQYFREQGYITAGVGKTFDSRNVDEGMDAVSWSLPYGERYMPPVFEPAAPYPQGYYQEPETQERYREVERMMEDRKEKGLEPIRRPFGESPGSRPPTESLDVSDQAYVDGANTVIALKLLEELATKEKPFFLSVGYYKPHLPFVAPEKYWELYDREAFSLAEVRELPATAPDLAFQNSWELRTYSDIPDGPLPEDLQRELIHGYYACVSYIDTQVGRLLDQLDELDLTEKTIIVLFGDHGFHLGDHGMWCKHSNYEQAVRSPLIIAVPEMAGQGESSDAVTGFIDLFPTLSDLAGLPIPDALQGVSLRPILDNPAAEVKKVELSQFPRNWEGQYYMGYSLRDRRYRYTAWLKSDRPTGTPLADAVWEELYDYETDPEETVNLASHPDHQTRVSGFARILKQKLSDIQPNR
ncbi:MAG: sulfatase [Kiritimatiellia bacterium]